MDIDRSRIFFETVDRCPLLENYAVDKANGEVGSCFKNELVLSFYDLKKRSLGRFGYSLNKPLEKDFSKRF